MVKEISSELIRVQIFIFCSVQIDPQQIVACTYMYTPVFFIIHVIRTPGLHFRRRHFGGPPFPLYFNRWRPAGFESGSVLGPNLPQNHWAVLLYTPVLLLSYLDMTYRLQSSFTSLLKKKKKVNGYTQPGFE